MSSERPESARRSLSFRLTIWYAFFFLVATLGLLAALYFFVDESVDEEWKLTRSRMIASWAGDTTEGRSGMTISEQTATIARHIPSNLGLATHFRRAFTKVALPILLLALIGGYFVTRRGLRPVHNLGRTVRNIVETGATDKRVPMHGEKGELAELVKLFNRMLDRNERLLEAMHESLDNVAHDLRTPMTRLRAAAEAAIEGPEDTGAYRSALGDCLEESDRVLVMLTTLMDVAEAENGALPLDLSTVTLAEVVGVVTDLYELVAEESGIRFAIDTPPDLRLHADRTRLRQVLANLVDNALKYGPSGETVSIVASRLEDHAEIAVSDQGPGIGAEDLERIWDRLYRGDHSRTQRGLGLGLSFVKAITEAHGGSVRVETQQGRGSRFILSWPISS